MQFRNDIQGLRAVAFLLVFFFHLNPSWLPGGFVGVDMFFVISGYLITSILMKQKEKGIFSFLTFYEKRIKRIVPAHFAMLIVVLIASFFVFLSFDFSKLKLSTVLSGLFISNMEFANGQSYFGVGLNDHPLLHTWSLAIEMQFYFFLPLILIFINNKFLPWALGAGIVILTGYSTYEMAFNNATSSMYFSLLARMPEFFVGALLSILFLKRPPISEKVSILISSIGLVALLGSAFLIDEETMFPGVTALIPTIGTGLLLISGKNFFSNLLSKRPIVHLGELSYSLYLWHWPIMAMMRYQEGRIVAYDFSLAEIIFISALTYALAWLSYTLIENAFRTTGNKKFILVFSPVVVLLVGLTFILPLLSQKRAIPKEYTRVHFGLDSHGKKNVETMGDTTSTGTPIFLFGDSHALNFKPFLDYLGKRHHFSFRTLTTNSYPAIRGVNRNEISQHDLRFFDVAQEFLTITENEVAKSEIIILHSYGFDRAQSLEKALFNFAENLRPDQSIIILNTFPIVDRNPVRVNKSFLKETDYNFQIVNKSKNQSIVREFADRYENVHYYDLSKSKVFVNPPFYNDTLMYHDDRHINIYGSLVMAKDLDSSFMSLLNSLKSKNKMQRLSTRTIP